MWIHTQVGLPCQVRVGEGAHCRRPPDLHGAELGEGEGGGNTVGRERKVGEERWRERKRGDVAKKIVTCGIYMCYISKVA